MKNKVAGFLVVAIAAIALTGCNGKKTFDPTTASPNGTQSYKDGYRDGCNSAYAIHDASAWLDRYRRDSDRIDSDPEYKKGWYRGKDLCLAYIQNAPFYAGAPNLGSN